METYQTEILRQHRLDIVKDVEPKGKVLDALYEDGVLTENDVERVTTATTRKDRCHLLLSILPTRGPVAYGSFKKALEKGHYDYLAKKLEAPEPDIDGAGVYADNNRVCTDCDRFFRQLTIDKKLRNRSFLDIVKPRCCLFLNNIEPKDIVDHLYHDGVISSDDIDRIMSGVTRRDRCQLMLEVILANEDIGIGITNTLKVALEKKYSYIADTLPREFEDIQLLRKSRKGQPRYADETSEKRFVHRNNPNVTHAGKQTDFESTVPKLHQDDDTCLKLTGAVHDNDSTQIKQLDDDFDTVDGALAYDKVNGSIARYSLQDAIQGISPSVELNPDESKFYKDNSNVQIQQLCGQNEDMFKSHGDDNVEETLLRPNPCCDTNTKIDSRKERAETVSKEIVPKQMTALHSEKPNKRLTVAFNYLSTLINQGDFAKFQDVSSKLQVQFPENYDLMCIIGYLQTSRDLFQTNFDSAKSHINSTMALVPKTSNPRYFTLELFTAKTRMYITRKKLEKLQTTLDEAMMILETDPVGCTGRAAGWLYINNARNQTAQLSCLNLSKPSALQSYERLFESAKTSFQRSMTNFKQDGGRDGPFGFGYALCRLVILLLRCGDNGLTMDVLTPPACDVHAAGQYIQHLEDSDIVISKILDMHFRLAKCDYQFRRGNCVRAFEHAQIAHELATELNLMEFTEHAYNRVKCLRSKISGYSVSEEISEDECHRILFEESSEGEFSQQSE